MSKRTDDPENPELGADFFARTRHGLDHVPGPMRAALRDEHTRRRGRGPQRTPTKTLVSLRLDPDVVIAYRNTGRGWQGRINAVLKKTVRPTPTPHLTGTAVEAPAPRGRHVIAKKGAKKLAIEGAEGFALSK
jgi:uncharacterized protein (DUF4415 family)